MLVNLGVLRLQAGDLDGAAGFLLQAIQVDARSYPAYAALAAVRRDQGRTEEALAQFALAIERQPGLAALYRDRAGVVLASKSSTPAQRAQALSDLDRAIRLEKPDDLILARDHTDRGRLLALDGRVNEALAACDSAIERARDHEDAHRLRLDLLLRLKRHDDVIRSCDPLIARGKASAAIHEQRALVREANRDFSGAIEDFTSAMARGGDRAKLLRRRGWLYIVADAPALALHDFEEAIRLDPSVGDAFNGRGLARLRLGEYREAVADAERAISLGQPTADLYYKAARVYALATVVVTAKAPRKASRACACWPDIRTAPRACSARRSGGVPTRTAPPSSRTSSSPTRTCAPSVAASRRWTWRGHCRPRPPQGPGGLSNNVEVDRSQATRAFTGTESMITTLRSVRTPAPTRRRRRWPANPAPFSGTIFRLRPRVEWMEARTLLSTFLVSNTDDGGAGSLRQAILDSDATPGGTNTIDFDIPGSGQQTIGVVSPLPATTGPVVIDGTTQPGYAGAPLIAVAGLVLGSINPLSIGPDVTVRGLTIPGVTFGSGSSSSTFAVESVPFLQPGGVRTYGIVASTSGELLATAAVPQGSPSPSLTLLDPGGQVVMQSGGAATRPAAAIDTYLTAGTYSLQVHGGGSLTLQATMTPADPPFQPLPVGAGPVAIAEGDFAGNGDLDLAVANKYSGSVSILMGNSDGTFRPAQNIYGVGNTPVGIVAGDFRGVGIIDLAVVNQGGNSVSFLVNNGQGTFHLSKQTDPAVGSSPTAIAAGDFGDDGKVDLAIAYSGGLDVLMGNGDGTFQPAVAYSAGVAPSAIVVGDFGNDGQLDLAVAYSGTISSGGSNPAAWPC